MPPWPKINPYEFERYINGRFYEGEVFCINRTALKRLAGKIRLKFGLSARSIVLPESYTCGGHYGGYPERYVLMLPTDQDIDEEIISWIHAQDEVDKHA